MGLLDRLVGADAARQFRERMNAATATAQAAIEAAAVPGPPAAGRPASGATASRTFPGSTAAAPRAAAAAAPQAVAAAAPAAARAARPPGPADPLSLAGFDGSDFPTSILATGAEPAPPLLAAFANRPALLAAIVFSEALAPPVALR